MLEIWNNESRVLILRIHDMVNSALLLFFLFLLNVACLLLFDMILCILGLLFIKYYNFLQNSVFFLLGLIFIFFNIEIQDFQLIYLFFFEIA